MTQTYDTTRGFAAFSTATPRPDDDQFPVHGVLIADGDLSTGMSGRPTVWPGDVLREAADRGVFENKPITLVESDDPDQHWGVERTDDGLDIEMGVPFDVKVGEITATRYEPGTGLVFEGFVADAEAAAVIERGLAQVSPVMGTRADPTDDADVDVPEGADVFEAREIVAVRDVAIVSDGAFGGNQIQAGPVAAMAAQGLSALFDAAAEVGTDGANPGSDGDDHPSTADDSPTDDGDDPAGDDADPATDDDPTADDDPAGPLPTDAPGLRGALARAVADTSVENRKTIKDGAHAVDPRSSLARRVLGNRQGEAVDPDDPVARQALGTDDDADDGDPDPVDTDDPVTRAVLRLEADADDE